MLEVYLALLFTYQKYNQQTHTYMLYQFHPMGIKEIIKLQDFFFSFSFFFLNGKCLMPICKKCKSTNNPSTVLMLRSDMWQYYSIP